MHLGDILTQAFQITRREKVLWLFAALPMIPLFFSLLLPVPLPADSDTVAQGGNLLLLCRPWLLAPWHWFFL